MGELKPCPFCNGDAESKLHDTDGDWWLTKCVNRACCIRPSTDIHQTMEAADDAWNRRAALAVPQDAQRPSDAMVLHAQNMVGAGFFDAKWITDADLRRVWITMNAERAGVPVDLALAQSGAVDGDNGPGVKL